MSNKVKSHKQNFEHNASFFMILSASMSLGVLEWQDLLVESLSLNFKYSAQSIAPSSVRMHVSLQYAVRSVRKGKVVYRKKIPKLADSDILLYP